MPDDIKDLQRIADVDQLVHHPTRLAILIFLLPRPRVTFPEVIEALDLTSGNLSSHMKKLEASQLIIVEKKFVDARPTTLLSLTSIGKQAIQNYAHLLRDVLDQVD